MPQTKPVPVKDLALDLGNFRTVKQADERSAIDAMISTSPDRFAELLGHASMKMSMRYAHLSPAFLSAEVSLLDPPAPESAGLKSRPTHEGEGEKSQRARKGQRASNDDQRRSEVPGFVRENGSPHWTISATG